MHHSVILCPLDFSVDTASVVGFAASLARTTHTELRLLHVCDPALKASAQEAMHLLDDWQRRVLRTAHCCVSTAVRIGEAAPEIVADASSYSVSLIVMGAHGCTHRSRFLVGSTAEQVLRAAPCLTMVVDLHGTEASFHMLPESQL